MKKPIPLSADLFLTFARIGCFTFGGGYAMLGIIEKACVEEKKWISHEDMMNITVIAESTPGPIAINCATFVGHRQKGFWGALWATLGMVIPSFVIIFLIACLMDHFLEITWIANAFKGIKLAVGILILDAAINMIRKMKKKPLPLTLMILACIIMLAINVWSLHFSSIVLMLLGGCVSTALFAISRKKEVRK